MVTGEPRLLHREAKVGGQVHHRGSGDAFKNRVGGWCDQGLLAHQKQIGTRALGHIPIRIEQDGLVDALTMGVGFGEVGVHVVAADLGLGHHRARMVTRETRHTRPQSFVQGALAEVHRLLPHANRDVWLAGVKRQVPAAVGQPYQRTDVAVAVTVGAYRLAHSVGQGVE